jgi:hypothetical protein
MPKPRLGVNVLPGGLVLGGAFEIRFFREIKRTNNRTVYAVMFRGFPNLTYLWGV